MDPSRAIGHEVHLGGKRHMSRPLQRLLTLATASLLAIAAEPVFVPVQAGTEDDAGGLAKINHVVVIYQENHSFDNLYGAWEGVNGRANADSTHTIQVGQAGTRYTCLLQNDFSLTSPPLPSDCLDATTATMFASHFTNAPFQIDAYIPVTTQTCPKPEAGTNALPPG